MHYDIAAAKRQMLDMIRNAEAEAIAKACSDQIAAIRIQCRLLEAYTAVEIAALRALKDGADQATVSAALATMLGTQLANHADDMSFLARLSAAACAVAEARSGTNRPDVSGTTLHVTPEAGGHA